VTYLRQDFSALERVPDHGQWPEYQRFDYVIRLRELTPAEVQQRKSSLAAPKATYPQREAVLFALCELSGLNARWSTAKWKSALGLGVK
jgi:hypothetical protein